MFKPKFSNKKNKKEIVTYEFLERDLEKKQNLNKELKDEIKSLKIELEIFKK